MAALFIGNNVRLKPLEGEEDVRYLFRAFNDQEVNGIYLHFEPKSWDEFQRSLKGSSGSVNKLCIFLIEKIDEKRIIGSIAHFVPNPYYNNFEIGYGIDRKEDRGKGYAREAVNLLIDYLFLTKNIERVQVTINADNLASQKLIERCGFKNEGRLRNADYINGNYSDVLIYGLLMPEWRSLRQLTASQVPT